MNKPTTHNSTDSGVKVANAPKTSPHNGAATYTKLERRPGDAVPVEPKQPIVEPVKPTPQKEAVNAPPVAAQGDDDLMSQEKKS